MDGSVLTLVLTDKNGAMEEDSDTSSMDVLKFSSKGNPSSASQKTQGNTPVTKDGDVNNIVSQTASVKFRHIDFSDTMVQNICRLLYRENIQSVLVEGGRQTLQSFIDADLWDEARIFTGAAFFKKGIPSPRISGKTQVRKSIFSDMLNILYHENAI